MKHLLFIVAFFLCSTLPAQEAFIMVKDSLGNTNYIPKAEYKEQVKAQRQKKDPYSSDFVVSLNPEFLIWDEYRIPKEAHKAENVFAWGVRATAYGDEFLTAFLQLGFSTLNLDETPNQGLFTSRLGFGAAPEIGRKKPLGIYGTVQAEVNTTTIPFFDYSFGGEALLRVSEFIAGSGRLEFGAYGGVQFFAFGAPYKTTEGASVHQWRSGIYAGWRF